MKHSYSDEFTLPPALILPANVRIPHNEDAFERFRAKIDTAADISVIPRRYVERFRPLEFNKRRVRQTGRLERSFLVEIELEGSNYSVEVISGDAPYILIGRDILNQCTLIADGPNETFELIHPSN